PALVPDPRIHTPVRKGGVISVNHPAELAGISPRDYKSVIDISIANIPENTRTLDLSKFPNLSRVHIAQGTKALTSLILPHGGVETIYPRGYFEKKLTISYHEDRIKAHAAPGRSYWTEVLQKDGTTHLDDRDENLINNFNTRPKKGQRIKKDILNLTEN